MSKMSLPKKEFQGRYSRTKRKLIMAMGSYISAIGAVAEVYSDALKQIADFANEFYTSRDERGRPAGRSVELATVRSVLGLQTFESLEKHADFLEKITVEMWAKYSNRQNKTIKLNGATNGGAA